MPLDEKQKELLTELLAIADPGEIPGYLPAGEVVPKHQLKRRIEEKNKARDALTADYEARISALETDYKDARARIEEYENKGKSADQLAQAEIAKRDETIKSWERRYEEINQVATHRLERMKNDFMRNQVADLIANTGVPPARLTTAIREALAENEFSVSVNENDFVLELKQDGLAVDDMKKSFVDGWYLKRKDLHSRTGTEMPSPKAGRPPGELPPKDELEGLTPVQQLAYATQKVMSTG